MSLFKTKNGILSKVLQVEKSQSIEVLSIPTYDRKSFVKNWKDLLQAEGHFLFSGNQQDLNESTREVSTKVVKYYKKKCEEKVVQLKLIRDGNQINETFKLLRQRNKSIIDSMNRCLIGFPVNNLETCLSISNYSPITSVTQILKEHLPLNYNDIKVDGLALGYKQYIGLRGFDQWKMKGIEIPELNHVIIPFYSVFVPTQREYVYIFINQLTNNLSWKKDVNLLDIGCGTGVLGFIAYTILNKNNYNIKVNLTSVDINENAVKCSLYNAKKLHIHSNSIQANVYPEIDASQNKYDIIIANPPHIPIQEKITTDLEKASYDEFGNTIETILSQLKFHLLPKTGRLYLIYSNLSEKLGLHETNFIRKLCDQNHLKIISYDYENIRLKEPKDDVQLWEKEINEIRNNYNMEIYVIGIE